MKKVKFTISDEHLRVLFPDLPNLGTLPRKKKKKAKKYITTNIVRIAEEWVKNNHIDLFNKM